VRTCQGEILVLVTSVVLFGCDVLDLIRASNRMTV